MAAASRDVTRLLKAVNLGEAGAWENLLGLIHEELRLLAASQMRHERPTASLQRTALVNEAFMRLMGEQAVPWRDRVHFFAAAAEAMRRVLVDWARRRRATRRGGGVARRTLSEGLDVGVAEEPGSAEALHADVEALDLALARLEQDERHESKCTVVKLRFFVGLSLEETAQAMGVSVATVKRDWAFAKAWLYNEMTKDERP